MFGGTDLRVFHRAPDMTETFLDPDRVADGGESAAIVDVRRPEQYRAGHVPGAVNVPFESFRDPTDGAPGKLPTAERFGALMGGAGIAPTDRIVAYDGGPGVYASRLLVTAAVYGHGVDRLGLLDGGIDAWTADRDLSDGTPDAAPTDYDAARAADGPLVSAADLETALDSEAAVVDTRPGIEFRAVHLPDAINVDWELFVGGEPKRLLPREELSAIAARKGLEPGRPVRLYCNTARRLSFVYAVLRHLGREDVAIYEGGIAAWADYGGPVATS